MQSDGCHEVAVKCLDMPHDERESFFKIEGETLKKMRELRHPHLIQAHAAYQRQNTMGFVFPFADGGNLYQLWTCSNPKTSPSVVSWALMQMKGLADGVRALHNTGRLHGDIKPSNILIFKQPKGEGKHLVIADIGLAKYYALYTREPYFSRRSQDSNRRYEPPEVAAQGLPLSRKHDLWSLGCVLLEFLIWLNSGVLGYKEFLTISKVDGKEARFWEAGSVRSVVTEYMASLKNKIEKRGQGYSALKDVLDLIRERLLVGADQRVDSTHLFDELVRIQSQYLHVTEQGIVSLEDSIQFNSSLVEI